jgi:hypothetical protein
MPQDGVRNLLGPAHTSDGLLRNHPRTPLGVPPVKRSIIGVSITRILDENGGAARI